jgi:ribosomal protein S27AE
MAFVEYTPESTPKGCQAQPPCPKCKTQMFLAHVETGLHVDRFGFECSRCQHIEVVAVPFT